MSEPSHWGAEHQRLADAVERLIGAIGIEATGDLPTACNALAHEFEQRTYLVELNARLHILTIAAETSPHWRDGAWRP